MKNKALIEMNDIIEKYLDPYIAVAMHYYLDKGSNVLTRDNWDNLSTELKKQLVLAKCEEVNELYPESPLYGAYEDIYITLVEEDITGLELESELEQFARDVIFREYSNKELEEMIKHFSIAQLEDWK